MNWNDIRSGKIKLQMADLCFSRGQSAFGRAIRWAETGKGESPALVNHVFGITDLTKTEYLITEALSHVSENSLYDYEKQDQEIVIFRHRHLTAASAGFVASLVKYQKGQIYSPLRIAGQFIDKMAEKLYRGNFDLFSRLSIPFSKYCSILWSVPYSYIGITFGTDPKSASPDEMFDYCMEHPEEWDLIFLTDGIERLIKKAG